MTQKHDLTDIGNALQHVLETPTARIIRSGSIGVLATAHRVTKSQIQLSH